MEEAESSNFQLFRDCVSAPLIENSTKEPSKKSRNVRGNRRRRTAINPLEVETDDAEELAEFIDYLASEIFNSFPADLRTLTYSIWLNSPTLQALYTVPLTPQTSIRILNNLPPSIPETLTTYAILPPSTTAPEYLAPLLQTYLTTILTPPPAPPLTRDLVTACEICERSWIPLTYHHLIPKAVHAKVLKRGWHTPDMLGNVAWLCRACHSFVHRVAGHEELAREWFTVERLLEREDVRMFAGWVGRIRWKAT